MMNDNLSQLEIEMSQSQAKSYKELNCMIMNSTGYIKNLPQAEPEKIKSRAIVLPDLPPTKSKLI